MELCHLPYISRYPNQYFHSPTLPLLMLKLEYKPDLPWRPHRSLQLPERGL